jgi:hypothetical protein
MANAIQIEFLRAGVQINGVPVSYGHVYAWQAGSSSVAQNMYVDSGAVTPAANPYTLDQNGRALLFGNSDYHFVVTDKNGVTVLDMDNVGVKYPASLPSPLNADTLNTHPSGNSTGQIPLSNGTVNTNLNADMVDGIHAAALAKLAGGNTFTGTQIFSNEVDLNGTTKFAGTMNLAASAATSKVLTCQNTAGDAAWATITPVPTKAVTKKLSTFTESPSGYWNASTGALTFTPISVEVICSDGTVGSWGQATDTAASAQQVMYQHSATVPDLLTNDGNVAVIAASPSVGEFGQVTAFSSAGITITFHGANPSGAILYLLIHGY